jgi:hypothetical protein
VHGCANDHDHLHYYADARNVGGRVGDYDDDEVDRHHRQFYVSVRELIRDDIC